MNKMDTIDMRGQPKLSEKWECQLFGQRDFILTPQEGKEPNFFWRWMQYLLVGNKWRIKPTYKKYKNIKKQFKKL